ncbi:hypothetical protein [Turicimonas muris]|uniref:hypothetical protein n=1 Tax=Turicimonas muris TaxID=1796652 RepID=UPI0032B20D3B
MIKIEWQEFFNYKDEYATELKVNGECVTNLLYSPKYGWEIFGVLYGDGYDDLKDTLKNILKNQKDINSLPNDDVSKKKVMDFIESIIRLELV